MFTLPCVLPVFGLVLLVLGTALTFHYSSQYLQSNNYC